MTLEAHYIAATKEIESAWKEIIAAEEARPRLRRRFYAHCLECLRSARQFRRSLERGRNRRARALRRPGKAK